MYIQITTRCNMECEHCCYACTSKGEDMSLEVFKECIELDEYPALGGGEPTVHPQFEKFLLLAIGGCEQIWLATNGKKTETAIMLAKLAKSGVIACDLSLDDWHEPIDEKVVAAFYKEHKTPETSTDYRSIRDVGNSPRGGLINAGRCDFGVSGCPCEDLFVRPNGDVYQCGCEGAPKLGNVMDTWEWPEEIQCYKFNREKQ